MVNAPAEIARLTNIVKEYKPAKGQTWQVVQPVLNGADADAYPRLGAGYAVVYVTSPEERKVIVAASVVGSAKVWINGAAALDINQFGRYPFCGHRKAPGQIKKGTNEVLMWVPGLHGQTNFACDLLDADGHEMPDLKYSLQP